MANYISPASQIDDLDSGDFMKTLGWVVRSIREKSLIQTSKIAGNVMLNPFDSSTLACVLSTNDVVKVTRLFKSDFFLKLEATILQCMRTEKRDSGSVCRLYFCRSHPMSCRHVDVPARKRRTMTSIHRPCA